MIFQQEYLLFITINYAICTKMLNRQILNLSTDSLHIIVKKKPLCVISYFYVIKLVFPHLFLWFNNQYRTVYRVTVYYVRLFDFFAFEIALWSSGMSLASGAKSPLFEPHI